MSILKKFTPAPCPFCESVADHPADHKESCYFRLKAAFDEKFGKENFLTIYGQETGLRQAIADAQNEINAAWNTRPIEDKLIRENVALIMEML